ncbi:MAG: sulfur carrier protein ThiS [Stellaceae bacterium]|jgi:sulfur carrier protein
MTRIRINGVDEEIAVATIKDLLIALGVDPAARFLAIAVNGSVVHRSEWDTKSLTRGDDVEIVRPFSGG